MGQQKENQLSFLAVVFSVISTFGVWCFISWSHQGINVLWTFLAGFAALVGFVGASTMFHMQLRGPADNHRLKTLLLQHFGHIALKTAGVICKPIWKRTTVNISKGQMKLLISILNQQKDTEYGRETNFHEIKSVEDFREQHPLTDYKHYEEMIERASQGEINVLTKDEVNYIALTSGTTGKNKKYIKTKHYGGIQTILAFIVNYSQPSPFNSYLRRSLWFVLPAPLRKTKGGIPMGPASAKWVIPPKDNVYPPICLNLTKEEESYYAQAVFALADPELGSIQSFSPNLLYTFFKFIVKNIEQLAEDIERGKIVDSAFIKDPQIRALLSEQLVPDPWRAVQIRREVSQGIDRLARRIWPDLGIVSIAKSGGFAHCAKILESSYLKGITCTCHGHGSTEAWCGMNLDVCNPDKDVYTFMTTMTFFEFIPLENVDSESPKTLLIQQLSLGERYELVVTTFNGLYRFRLGDIIKIVGFYNEIPQYEFCYRLGQRLNLAFERTPEALVHQAVEFLSSKLPPGVSIEDYSSTESHVLEDVTGERNSENYYVFFLEMLKDGEAFKLENEHVVQLDKFLRENHAPYDVYRNKGSIAPVRVLQVRRGAFDELKRIIWNGYQNTQFKMPRVVRREPLLTSLLKNEFKF